MTNKEKIKAGKVMMMYPKQWVVMTELEDQLKPFTVLGHVHYVTDDEDEARKVLREIRAKEGAGKAMLVEGWDDTPQIGGLGLWRR